MIHEYSVSARQLFCLNGKGIYASNLGRMQKASFHLLSCPNKLLGQPNKNLLHHRTEPIYQFMDAHRRILNTKEAQFSRSGSLKVSVVHQKLMKLLRYLEVLSNCTSLRTCTILR